MEENYAPQANLHGNVVMNEILKLDDYRGAMRCDAVRYGTERNGDGGDATVVNIPRAVNTRGIAISMQTGTGVYDEDEFAGREGRSERERN